MSELHWDPGSLMSFVHDHGADIAPGGVFRLSILRPMGSPDRAAARLAATGDLMRLRHGWYALPGADEMVVRAVSGGGVVSCVSALSRLGVWTPQHRELHVRASRDGDAAGSGLHRCRSTTRLPSPIRAVDPLAMALNTASGCVGPDELIAIVDSALNLGLLTGDAVPAILKSAPGKTARRLRQIDWAESGTETFLRLGVRRLGLPVRVQVSIEGVGRVDLLVGDRLVLEADSVAYHANPEAYHRDRRRDLRLTRLGYRVLRLTWEQVTFEWNEVVDTIVTLVAAGEHRWTAAQRAAFHGPRRLRFSP